MGMMERAGVCVCVCVCDSDLQHHCCQSPARVSASIFAPLMRMLETCTHSASRCICIHIGYLLVLVPFTKCVCVWKGSWDVVVRRGNGGDCRVEVVEGPGFGMEEGVGTMQDWGGGGVRRKVAYFFFWL